VTIAAKPDNQRARDQAAQRKRSQQMQLEFAAGFTDLDDKPVVILVCVRVGHGLLSAHPDARQRA